MRPVGNSNESSVDSSQENFSSIDIQDARTVVDVASSAADPLQQTDGAPLANVSPIETSSSDDASSVFAVDSARVDSVQSHDASVSSQSSPDGAAEANVEDTGALNPDALITDGESGTHTSPFGDTNSFNHFGSATGLALNSGEGGLGAPDFGGAHVNQIAGDTIAGSTPALNQAPADSALPLNELPAVAAPTGDDSYVTTSSGPSAGPVLAYMGDMNEGIGFGLIPVITNSNGTGTTGGGTTGSGTGGTLVQTTSASSGLVINVVYDASVQNAPVGFTTAINQVVSFYESHFSNPVTVTIDVGYGEIAGQALSAGALGETETYLTSVSYSQLQSALVNNANAIGDTAAAASLSSTSPVSGGNYYIATAEAAALGITGASSSLNAYIGFGTANFSFNDANGVASNQYDFFGVAAHEISEAMGRTMMDGSFGGYEPLDLFHYSAPGVRDFSGTTAGYASADGGVTKLNSFNTNSNGDYGDWASSAGHDAYLAFVGTGAVLPVTVNDLTEMNLLGWKPSSVATAPIVTIQLVKDTGSSSTDHISSSAAVSGTADPNAVVTLTEGSTVLGTATANSSGAWSFTPTGLAQGAQTITASETNSAGLTGSASLNFTLDTAVPVVTVHLTQDTGSSSTDYITSNPALTGTADPNATVKLTEGTTVLGTVTANASGVWSFTPTNLAQGAHTITATDTDVAGNIGSASLSFTLDSAAPTVTMTLVQDTGSSSTDDITSNPALSGTAQANSVVTLTEGSTVLGTATANASGVWSFTPTNLAQGSHTITASETDVAGNTGSAGLSFTLDSVAPTVTMGLTQDTGSSSTDHITSNAALSGTAQANSVVTLTEGSTVLGTATANASGVWSFTPTNLAQGSHTITASETDVAGNTGSASLSFTLDSVAPTVTTGLVQDTGSSSTDHITSNPALSGTAQANSVVTLTEGSTVLGTATADANGAWSFTPTALAQGAHTITASETDVAGNIGSASLSFTLDSVTPTVTMGLVQDTGSSSTDHITSNPALSGTAQANSVVTLAEGSTVLGTATADANGAWSFTPTGLAQGTHTITASETDVAGNTGSASLSFTFDTVAPTVTLALTQNAGSSSADPITSNPAVSGTAQANSVVTLTEGSSVLGTTTADANGSWSFTPANLAQGAHTITANETDVAGNTGSASLSFILDSVAPTVTMGLVQDTGSSSTDNITSNPALSGTAQANAVVTLTEGSTVLGAATADANGFWSFTPSSLAQGAHTIAASETDVAGNTGSASLSFTLDSVAPTVTVGLVQDTGSSSTDHTTSNPALSGTTEANSVVTITEGSTVLGAATASASGAWSFTPTNLADGTHTIIASETDVAGNPGSASLSFTLDSVAPTVTLGLVQDTGASSTDHITSNPALSGTAEANSVVTFTEGSTVLGTATANASGAWSFTPTNLADGTHTITVSDTDLAGNTGSASQSFTLDTATPAAPLIATDAVNSDGTVTLSGTAEANATITVSDGQSILGAATADASGVWSYTTGALASGTQTFVATATDVAGNVSVPSNSIDPFVGQLSAPTITSFSPDTGVASDGITNATTLTLAGYATAGSVVEVFDGAVQLGTATADNSGAWNYATSGLANGTHDFTATDTFDGAVSPTSAAMVVTVDTVPPTVTVGLVSDTGSSSTDNVTSNPALSGSAEANSVVTISEGSTVLGTTTADANGAWSFTPTGLAVGSHTITASETDIVGNTGTASLTFTLDSATPTVTSVSVAASGVSGNAGTLTTGATAVLTLALSECVTVSGGLPTLTLNDGGTATYDATNSTAMALAFDYTVAAGQSTSSLAVTGLNLNGASIADVAGNTADMTGAGTIFTLLSVNGSALTTKSVTYSNGMTATWTYNSDSSLHELVYQNIVGQKYTSTDTLYANGKAAGEVWTNGVTTIQTETWNADGTVHDVHYYGITNQAYTDYDVVYVNNKQSSAIYSNGMSSSWTYNADGTLHELVTQGIAGKNYTSTDTLYANGKATSEVWANGTSTVQTEIWNANGSVHDIHYYGITNQAYTDYDVVYGGSNKPASAIYSNGMTSTWTYNADGTLHELVTQGITGQKYTSTDTLYVNGKAASEVWTNGANTIQTETWNADGTKHDIHYYGIVGQAYTDYDTAYANNRPVLATYSNGLTTTWSYNADGTLHEVIAQGISSQKWTSTDTLYANGKATSEVWANGATTIQTETWNADGSRHDIHYYGITGQAYTDYDVVYANNKPVSASYSNGMTASWTYNPDGSSEYALNNVQAKSYLSSTNVYDTANHLAAQNNLNTNGSQTLHGYQNGLTFTAGSSGVQVTLGGPGNDAFNFAFNANTAMTGGGANENFVLNSGFGNVTVADFLPHSLTNANNDVVTFGNGLFSSFADLQSHMAQNSLGTVISDGHGDSLTLTHVAMASLHANDFLL